MEKEKKPEMVKTAIIIPRDLWEAMREIARREERSLNKQIIVMMRKFVSWNKEISASIAVPQEVKKEIDEYLEKKEEKNRKRGKKGD